MQLQIPLIRQIDVLLVGGVTGAVALAEQLRREGRGVLLATPYAYLGEDRVGCWEAPLADGTPAGLKASLEDRLLACGASLYYALWPVRPLLDASDRRIAGWVFFSPNGYVAVSAQVVVDATRDGFLPQQAHLWQPGTSLSSRVMRLGVLGGCSEQGGAVTVAMPLVETDVGRLPLCLYERAVQMREGDFREGLRQEARLRLDAWGAGTRLMAPLPSVEGRRCGWDEAEVARAAAPLCRLGQAELPWMLSHSGAEVRRAQEWCVAGRRVARGEEEVTWLDQGPRRHGVRTVGMELSCVAEEDGDYDVVVAGGGASGAHAAIAAAQMGGRVLCVEALSELGGQAMPERADAPYAHWLLESALGAGVEVRFRTTVCGVLMRGHAVCGVALLTDTGVQTLVRTRAVVDATGAARVACAAGAEVLPWCTAEPAPMAAGVAPLTPGQPQAVMADQFLCEGDCEDITRALVQAHAQCRDAFEVAPFPQLRERRGIVGEVTVQPPDVVLERRWDDTVAEAYGCLNGHGFPVHPFSLLCPPDEMRYRLCIPYRAMVPRKVDGVLVTGQGISVQRDAQPALCTPEMLRRLGMASGLAAAMAVRTGVRLRELAPLEVQRRLAVLKVLPLEAAGGAAPPSPERLRLARIFARPDQARREVQARYAKLRDPHDAEVLAFLGDTSGRDALRAMLETADWDAGRDYRDTLSAVSPNTPVDGVIFALRAIGGARKAVLRMAAGLRADAAFSHLRAVSMYFLRWPDIDAAPVLERLLTSPDFSGHAVRTLAEARRGGCAEEREARLKELYVAAALYACDARSARARTVLEAYRDSLETHLSCFAAAQLKE